MIEIGVPLRRNSEQVQILNQQMQEEPNHDHMLKLQCNCRFYTIYNISCAHIM